MRWTFIAAGSGVSMRPSDPGSHWQTQAWHAFVSGTFGAGGAVQIEYSPDGPGVTDAAARWFAPLVLLFSAGGDTWFEARFRRIRARVTGGDGTTNLIVEIV